MKWIKEVYNNISTDRVFRNNPDRRIGWSNIFMAEDSEFAHKNRVVENFLDTLENTLEVEVPEISLTQIESLQTYNGIVGEIYFIGVEIKFADTVVEESILTVSYTHLTLPTN